jgi:hypothetical protein
MSDLVDMISDQEDNEQERTKRVAARSDVIFNSLFDALNDRVSRYNDRHPQGIGVPNAIWIKRSFDSLNQRATIQKNTEPKTSFGLEFPVNSGAMECTFALDPDHYSITITLDITNGVPDFYIDGESLSAVTVADALLQPVLTATRTAPKGKRPIGFQP